MNLFGKGSSIQETLDVMLNVLPVLTTLYLYATILYRLFGMTLYLLFGMPPYLESTLAHLDLAVT